MKDQTRCRRGDREVLSELGHWVVRFYIGEGGDLSMFREVTVERGAVQECCTVIGSDGREYRLVGDRVTP